MQNVPQAALRCPLFEHIAPERVSGMLGCLHARRASYEKNRYVYRSGDAGRCVGLVLSGSVCTIREDYFGRRSIISRIGESGLFGEAFASMHTETIPLDVIANEDCEVLFLDYRRMLTACGKACAHHARLIENTVDILAEHNLLLTRKIEHITRRTTREKLLSYLNEQAQLQGGDEFIIPFNREQLADYLCVERSAMSAELSRMRRDGLIAFERNRFRLLPAAREAF